jgi:hypothetical protein
MVVDEVKKVDDVNNGLLLKYNLKLTKKSIIMNYSNKLPQKKITKRYSYQETLNNCSATSDPDTTSPSPLTTTTHIFKK